LGEKYSTAAGAVGGQSAGVAALLHSGKVRPYNVSARWVVRPGLGWPMAGTVESG
jgi:hypothetical protein